MPDDATGPRRLLPHRRPGPEEAVQLELEHHLEERVDELVARGLSRGEARREAERVFGDRAAVERELRTTTSGTELTARAERLIESLVQDLRIALRGVGRRPGFASVVIATLAVAIGASTAVFSVLDAVLLRPLPYEDPGQLVMLRERDPDGGLWSIRPANLTDWQTRNDVFTDVVAINRFPRAYVNLLGGREPLRVPSNRVSAGFFHLLGVDAEKGRTFLPEDDAPGAPSVAIISHALWGDAFGFDPGVVGKVVRLDEEPHEIVGVMPATFVFVAAGVETPSLWRPGALPPETTDDRAAHTLHAVARLRSGFTIDQARAAMDVLALSLAEEYPESNRQGGAPWGIEILPFHRQVVAEVRPSLLVLAGAVGLVLLIAWFNVTNLLVARATTRRREIAVRIAMGGSRWRVGRQLLTESVMLSGLAGAAGVILGRWLIVLLNAFAPGSDFDRGIPEMLPFLSRAGLTGWVLGMTLLTCIVTATACGSVPAIRATRDPSGAGLKDGRRVARTRATFGQVMAALQVAMALVLLIGLGLLTSTMDRLMQLPLGFEPVGAHLLEAQLTQDRYASPLQGRSGALSLTPDYASLVAQAVENVAALPGVVAAGAVTHLPMQRRNSSALRYIEGSQRPSLRVLEGVPVQGTSSPVMVTPDYFLAMGIPVLEGRAFRPSDNASATPVAIVNRRLVDRDGLEDPVGKRVMVRFAGAWRSAEIIGVVGPVRGESPGAASQGTAWIDRTIYFPYTQPPEAYGPFEIDDQMTVNVVARSDDRGSIIGPLMREAFESAAPEAPIHYVGNMDDYLARQLADRRLVTFLIGALATMSLLLAVVGVYAVMAFEVGQRVQEMGIRLALGGRASSVVRLIVGQGVRIATLGALIGLAGAMASTRVLSAWLYEVSPTDPVVFLVLAIAMVGVAVLACLIPAWRATQVDPIDSLRAE